MLFDLFADVDEAGFLALEWALTRLLGKFIQAHLVEPILTFLALPRVLKDGRAESTQQVSWDFVHAYHVALV